MSAVLGMAWGQWTALGVAGTAPIADQAIDLEALVSFTPALRDHDPRLHDEALDWCVHHSHRLISIGRLRRLRSALPDAARAAYDEFAGAMNATATPKLPWPPGQRGTKQRTSEKSQSPDVQRRELVQLQLRCVFGVTVRAELLLRFLRRGMVHDLSPPIALTTGDLSDLGYSRPAISETLAELTRAGILERFRRGNRDHYDLARRYPLLELIDNRVPATAPNWSIRFRVLASLIAAETATRDKKPIIQADAIVKVLDHHSALLERISVKPPTQVGDWDALAPWAIATLVADGPPPR